MNILGISAFHHHNAACLVQDGTIISAVPEERFTRKKHDTSFPKNAIRYCLHNSGLKEKDLDFVVFYEKPLLKFVRLQETYLACAPLGIRSFMEAIPRWIKERLWINDLISEEIEFEGKILFIENHQAHAASVFFSSSFQEAAFLTVSDVGESATASLGVGKDNNIRIYEEIHFPHSLGLLYSAFAYYVGFKVDSDDHKMRELTPNGEPKYKDLILSELMDLKEDGSFKLNMKYFDYGAGLIMTNKRFAKLFDGSARQGGAAITQRERDLARSVQEATEEVILRMARHVHKKTGCKNLCLAGGAALNCVGNGKILREGPFENVWMPPAAWNAGEALGAALLVWYQYLGNKRLAGEKKDFMELNDSGIDEYDKKQYASYAAEK
ncbi:MAG: Carbamoyltransferase [Parcubacteria group bacterium GW2011_GWC2_45_7]|nr:MAG: Carbamoyltransferase [Parcubacteria group bacterium GW2011_GWC2_45_7]